MTIQEQTTSEGQIAEQDGQTTEYRMDGGTQAWLQVLGSWILFANSWFVIPVELLQASTFLCDRWLTGFLSLYGCRGLTNSFGVFETFYTEDLLTTSSSSTISWIGSIQLFLTMIVGVFAGWFLDAGHLKTLLALGTFLEIFGMMMTSLSTKYYQILLAQGICVGLGSGFLGLTSVAVIPLYFSKRRMIATGIAATGSSLGK